MTASTLLFHSINDDGQVSRAKAVVNARTITDYAHVIRIRPILRRKRPMVTLTSENAKLPVK